MDVYPEEYFAAPTPVLILSGLGSSASHTVLPPYPLLENGTLICCDQPPVTSPAGEELLQGFLHTNNSTEWIGTSKRGGRPLSSVAYKVEVVGRVGKPLISRKIAFVETLHHVDFHADSLELCVAAAKSQSTSIFDSFNTDHIGDAWLWNIEFNTCKQEFAFSIITAHTRISTISRWHLYTYLVAQAFQSHAMHVRFIL